MGKAIVDIVRNYCREQGIELRNMDEVADEIENELDSIIPRIVHQIGDLVEEETEA